MRKLPSPAPRAVEILDDRAALVENVEHHDHIAAGKAQPARDGGGKVGGDAVAFARKARDRIGGGKAVVAGKARFVSGKGAALRDVGSKVARPSGLGGGREGQRSQSPRPIRKKRSRPCGCVAGSLCGGGPVIPLGSALHRERGKARDRVGGPDRFSPQRRGTGCSGQRRAARRGLPYQSTGHPVQFSIWTPSQMA